MAHLSGTFYHPKAGRLVVTLNGTFFQGGYRDAGFPSTTNGVANILIRAFVGPAGSYTYTQPIDRYAPTTVVELDYPGSSVVWNMGTEEIAHVNPSGGIWSYGMGKLSLNVVLRKK